MVMITCKFEDGKEVMLRHAVVDVLVVKDNQLLMVKRTAKLLEGGKWGIIGGYVERDETLKQTVEREVMEETGYSIKDIKLLTIRDNPDVPGDNNRQNISFVYFCKAIQKVGEADWESDEQKWFDFTNLPSESKIAFDHFKYIKLCKEYLEKKFVIPVL
jgi:ADP-ribose pyrophosphatase YjhB (NUDIX family)